MDLRLRDTPLLNRRPDAVLYDASLPDDAVLRPQHCALVVEVMSPGSVTTDQTDKPAEYAAARIPHYWRVEHDPAEGTLSVFLLPARPHYRRLRISRRAHRKDDRHRSCQRHDRPDLPALTQAIEAWPRDTAETQTPGESVRV